MSRLKQNRTGRKILALLMFISLLFGLFFGVAYAADGPEEEALVLDKWVEETEDGFKLTLESYATGEDSIAVQKPLPLDIVLVLDESGSMADVLIHGCGNEDAEDVKVTPKGHLAEGAEPDDSLTEDSLLFIGHKVFGDDIDKERTYTVVYPADGTTRKIYYCKTCKSWFSTTAHKEHQRLAKWVPFEKETDKPTENHTDAQWMCKAQFYEQCGKTGRDILQESLNNFLKKLYGTSNPDNGEKVKNRVAIVGYGMGAAYIDSDGMRTQVYNDPGDGAGGSLAGNPETSAREAWCDVSSLDEKAIENWVNGVAAEGATPTHLGIKAAQLAFDNVPDDGVEREKVMILFTDGAPGGNYVNYGPGNASGSPDWVTPGIRTAQEMKAKGVTIYSVGLFPAANGYNAQGIYYDVTQNGQGNDGFFANANCFLHLVSSNYPDATGVDSEEWGKLSEEYCEETNSYYLGTDDADALYDIFDKLYWILNPGSTTVRLDKTAVVKDKVTSDFTITYTDKTANVTAYTMSYEGKDTKGNTVWKTDEDSISTTADINNPDKLHISLEGQTVSVTNFDFAENFVHMNGDEALGKKLVVEIGIAAAEDSEGGIRLATNASNKSHTDNAGIYGQESDTPAAEFPLPHVDLPAAVTIRKVVKESDSTETFSFEAEYIKAGNYENIKSEESSGINDSNYLKLKEGEIKKDMFTLKDGDIYRLENVEAGSSLTIGENAEGWNTTVITNDETAPIQPDADGRYTVTVTPGMCITFVNEPVVKGPDSDRPVSDKPEKPGKTEYQDDDILRTGDMANPAMWLCILAVSGMGITAMLVIGKKKQ